MVRQEKIVEVVERVEDSINPIKKESPNYNNFTRNQMNELLESSNHSIRYLEMGDLVNSSLNSNIRSLYSEGRTLLENGNMSDNSFVTSKENIELLFDIQRNLDTVLNDIEIDLKTMVMKIDNTLTVKKYTIENLYHKFSSVECLGVSQFEIYLKEDTLSKFETTQNIFNNLVDFVEEFIELIESEKGDDKYGL